MARAVSRTERLADAIQQEMARYIQQELKDPRLGLVTVSGVELSRDLSHAKVFVSFIGSDESNEVQVAILNRASGLLRHLLGKNLQIRVLPQLRFVYDGSIIEGNRMSALIDQVMGNNKPSPAVANTEADESPDASGDLQ